MSMNLAHEAQFHASQVEIVSNDLVKQIRKLRWIGMESEAKLLEAALRHVQAADVVLAVPPETD